MASTYKLTYFDTKGAAEPIRFLFAYGDIKYEDIRIKNEDWPQFKEKTPFGQLPFLEHNGKQVAQSIAIARYIAKQVNLVGKDDWENLEIDAIVDTISDFRSKSVLFAFEKDEDRKKTMKETIANETVPYYAQRFEAIVQKNNGYLALGRLTWADLYFAHMFPLLDQFIGSNILCNYPNLKVLCDKVNAIPAIKKWIEDRPKTEF